MTLKICDPAALSFAACGRLALAPIHRVRAGAGDVSGFRACVGLLAAKSAQAVHNHALLLTSLLATLLAAFIHVSQGSLRLRRRREGTPGYNSNDYRQILRQSSTLYCSPSPTRVKAGQLRGLAPAAVEHLRCVAVLDGFLGRFSSRYVSSYLQSPGIV